MNGDQTRSSSESRDRRRKILAVLGIVFIILAILLATYSVVVYSAWRGAEDERILEEKRALSDELEKQMSLARQDINQGNFELSLRRLDWIINLRPQYPGAAELREAAETSLSFELNPNINSNEASASDSDLFYE